MLDVYSTNLLVLNVGNEGMIHNINNHPIPPIPIHSRLSTSKPKVCGNLTHPHCVKVSRGCSFSYGHPISWGSTHTAVYKPLVTDWWTSPKMNGTNAVFGKTIVFSGRNDFNTNRIWCLFVFESNKNIMESCLLTLRNISPEEENPIKSMFFSTVRVCTRPYLALAKRCEQRRGAPYSYGS